MHNIEETDYGILLTTSGDLDTTEAEQLMLNLLNKVSAIEKPFSLIIDLRGLIPFSEEVLPHILRLHVLCKKLGLARSSIIYRSPVLKNQGKQISQIAETDNGDRFINADKIENWEDMAYNWVVNAIEPDDYSKRKSYKNIANKL